MTTTRTSVVIGSIVLGALSVLWSSRCLPTSLTAASATVRAQLEKTVTARVENGPPVPSITTDGDDGSAEEAVDRALLAAQSRDRQGALTDRFAREGVDAAWGPELAERTRRLLIARGLTDLPMEAVECRATLCRVRFSRSGLDVLSAAAPVFDELEMPSIAHMMPTGAVEVFVTRPRTDTEISDAGVRIP